MLLLEKREQICSSFTILSLNGLNDAYPLRKTGQDRNERKEGRKEGGKEDTSLCAKYIHYKILLSFAIKRKLDLKKGCLVCRAVRIK
jgi:hypothetical protein